MIDPRLPLTDIHRHLDGNIRAQTILDLGRQFNLALPANDLESLRPHVQITHAEPDLVSFLQNWTGAWRCWAIWTPAAAWPTKTSKTPPTPACTTPSCVFPLTTWR